MLDDDEAAISHQPGAGIHHSPAPRGHHRLPAPSPDVDPPAITLAESPEKRPRCRPGPSPGRDRGGGGRVAGTPSRRPCLRARRTGGGGGRGRGAAQREPLPRIDDVGSPDAVPARDGAVVEPVSEGDRGQGLARPDHVHRGPLAARPLRRLRPAHVGCRAPAAPRHRAATGDQHRQGQGEQSRQMPASKPSLPIHDEIVSSARCRVRSACIGVTDTKPSSTA